MNIDPRFDVMAGSAFPFRVLQWATAKEVAAYCERTGFRVVSERRIGLLLHEVTVSKTGASA